MPSSLIYGHTHVNVLLFVCVYLTTSEYFKIIICKDQNDLRVNVEQIRVKD